MGALLETVQEMAMAMAQMQKRSMEETTSATSEQYIVPSLLPPQFEISLVR